MTKKLNQIDYECKVNERVWWPKLRGERFEAVIISWDDNIATVRLDDGTEKTVEC